VHDLAVLQPFDCDKLHVAVPVDTNDLVGDVGGDGERRIADEARFAAGAHRLARLPMLGLAFDDEGGQPAQRVGAALGGHRLPHQLRRRLRRRRLRHGSGQQQRGRKCPEMFHAFFLPCWTDLQPSLRQVYHRRMKRAAGLSTARAGGIGCLPDRHPMSKNSLG
jgi:hypothetical protein